MFEVAAASRAGGDAPNEDFFLVADSWALVLDGITRYPDDGCVHDVPWYVARLGAAIAGRIADADLDLREILAASIQAVGLRHADTCDLRNPVSPGATVAIVRHRDHEVEWLLLGDCTIARRDHQGGIRTESDERLADLPNPPSLTDVGGIRRYPVDYIAKARNREGGFWVASTDPDAAAMARSGAWPKHRISALMLCSDGLTRLVDRFGCSWPTLFDLASSQGVGRLIALVREHGDRDPNVHVQAKRHDDATVVFYELRRGADPDEGG